MTCNIVSQKKSLQPAADRAEGRREGRDPLRRDPPAGGVSFSSCPNRLQLVLEVPALLGEERPVRPADRRGHPAAPPTRPRSRRSRWPVREELSRQSCFARSCTCTPSCSHRQGQNEEMVIGDPKRSQPPIVELRDPSGSRTSKRKQICWSKCAMDAPIDCHAIYLHGI